MAKDKEQDSELFDGEKRESRTAANLGDRETREMSEREKSWAPPSLLPEPTPVDGYVYRWIRTATLGEADNTNVSQRFREGWEPVPVEDHPEMQILTDHNSRFEGSIEVGGLLLCRTAEENMKQRDQYYANKTKQQIDAVDQSYLRESDPRMPVLRPENTTRVGFGNGRS
jgi:hypothetical protein